jgi:hypothetical protein
VDFGGDTVPVSDVLTGEVRAAKIFVAVLGASQHGSQDIRVANPKRSSEPG